MGKLTRKLLLSLVLVLQVLVLLQMGKLLSLLWSTENLLSLKDWAVVDPVGMDGGIWKLMWKLLIPLLCR